MAVDASDDTEIDLREDPGFLTRIRRRLDYPVLWLSILALPTGVFAAYGSNAFRLAIGQFGRWLHGAGGITTAWHQLAALAAGGLCFGLVLSLMKWERFRGVAHVILAVREKDGRMSARGGLVTAVSDGLSLSLGAPVGRYGPAVQLGSSLASSLGQMIGMSRTGLRILVGCGAAAGISAAFNAPIAGVIFAHEAIIGHFALRAFAPITVASVVAVGVTRFHGFEYIALKLDEARSHLAVWEYPAYAVLGMFAAVLAMVYMAGILRGGDFAKRLHIPIWLQPAIGGALAGVVGLWVPEVLGLGDETMQAVLRQDEAAPIYGLAVLAVFALAKLVASVCCLGLRFPGGVFTPAIFTGAMLGGVVGFATPGLDFQICVLVGMGALVSSVVGAPMAIILIVFELTENYEAATAVMIGVVASNAVVTRFYARSLFHRQIRRMGVDLDKPREQRLMAKRHVSEIVAGHALEVGEARPVEEVRQLITPGARGDIFVIDADGRLVGILPLSRIVRADDEQTAGELCEEAKVCLEASTSLWDGFLKIEEFPGYLVPVVDDLENRELIGVVREGDFIAAYREAVHESRAESSD